MKLAMVAVGYTAEQADQLRVARWPHGSAAGIWKSIRPIHREDARARLRTRLRVAQVFAPDVSLNDWESVLEKPLGVGERVLNTWSGAVSNSYGALAPGQVFRKTMRRGARSLKARVRLAAEKYGANGPGVRIGLHLIKGFSQVAAERIMIARAQAPFADVDDPTRRAALSCRELEALAAGNALASVAGYRRQAWWAVTAQQRVPELLRDAPMSEALLALPQASEGREIVDDYASLGLTLNRHPLALLRERLAPMRFKTAANSAISATGVSCSAASSRCVSVPARRTARSSCRSRTRRVPST